MNYDRNPKDAIDDPEPIVARDPNDDCLDPEDPNWAAWVEWHLSHPLTQDYIDELRQMLENYGDQAGLAELARLDNPTRFDYQRLWNLAAAKYDTRSDLRELTW